MMKDLILNYQSFIGTVIGAFLAALFGYFTQKCLDRARSIDEANKVLLLVKEEMNSITTTGRKRITAGFFTSPELQLC
ncbi:hypothetical protein IT084_03180 [Desulfallas sp. Bu1-1]|uniref:hypothetical protein n=1 Tax=Desulfallas sp. Bu1-1 TaxID=2787620 RepID=UPI0018A003B2|nr:hypothetical protein [Desulfallas sp. Bu1-1]MBF7081978.1 hypothetical protein [Desulfallas sp. Bu1-1]